MSEIIIYQNADHQMQVDVTLEDESVWLSQAQMVELFAKNKRTISEHINNIFKEGEFKLFPRYKAPETVQVFWDERKISENLPYFVQKLR